MTPLAHAAVGVVGWKYFSSPERLKALAILVFVSCFPDADFILYYLFGKPEVFIHQLYSHSIFIVLAAAFAVLPFLKTRRERIGVLVVGLSHLVMDLFVVDIVPPVGFRPFFPIWNKFFSYGFFPYVQRGGLAEVLSWQNAWGLGLEIVVFVLPAVLLTRRELASAWRNAVCGKA